MVDPQPRDASPEAILEALRPYLPADLNARLAGEVMPDSDSPEFARILGDVLDTLSSLQYNLDTYLPRPLILSKPTPGIPRAEWLEGTVLFVDVTGFTPLAERLRAMGEEGAERLNRMINDLFTAMLDPLSRSGGELLIFAGDAVQAYFPAADDAEDALWATRAGLRMARAIAPFNQGPTPLTVRIGLARGRFFAAQIGTAERMEYLVTGGPIQQAMRAEAQGAPGQIILAPELETLLPSQFRLTPIADGHHVVVDDLGDTLGDSELNAPADQQRIPGPIVSGDDPAALMQDIASALSYIKTIVPFFPPNVLRRIVAHQREGQFPGEHRLVAVMFVNLRGFEELIEALGPGQLSQLIYWINRYFIEAQETLAGCGGLVTHLDPYEKGFTLLCPFGAPLADEDTPHRVTAAALRLNERLRSLNQDLQAELGEHRLSGTDLSAGAPAPGPDAAHKPQLTHHIGISYGPIFTGQVGWQERREFVVVGDDVNLAARLMSRSQPNQILISGWVYDRVRQSFECHPLEPMRLKGKAKPVTVYSVDRRVPASAWLREAAVGPLVGRDEELASLENALDKLEAGQGGVLSLVGETGMGKTRLIAELARRARYWHVTLLAGRCLSYAQANPYTPWIEGLWRWFELDTAADGSERRARVYQRLEALELAKLAETFWALLGLPVSEAPIPRRWTPSQRRGRLDIYTVLQERIAHAPLSQQDLHLTLAWRLVERDPALAADIPSMWEHLGQRTHPDQALLTLFEKIAQREGPILFLVEDIQWADRASWKPLIALAQATSRCPIRLLVTVRGGQAQERWRAETGSAHLTLTGLDWANTRKLTTALIKARDASPELVSWLYHRAQGNPLFTSQLLYALAGANGLSTDTETGHVTLSKTLPSLPLSVREIMLSRIDRLPEETRTIVKLASVIGDTVPWELLTHLSQIAGVSGGARLIEHVKNLADGSLLTPEPPAHEFTFVHSLLQEAVYSSVPYAQRRKWHRSIGDYLVEGDVETVHQRLEALAYHYKHSDQSKLGLYYNRLAGDQARDRQAWEEAQGYYQAAIDLAALDPEFSEERSLAYERLGDVFALTERPVEAASAYEGALVDSPQPVRLEGKIGLVCPLLDNVSEATQRMTHAWNELDANAPLRPWLAAALGWLALRAQPKNRVTVAGSGAAAIAWWRRGQRIARGETIQLALKEMMAGRIPADYSRLIHLALDEREERETR